MSELIGALLVAADRTTDVQDGVSIRAAALRIAELDALVKSFDLVDKSRREEVARLDEHVEQLYTHIAELEAANEAAYDDGYRAGVNLAHPTQYQKEKASE